MGLCWKQYADRFLIRLVGTSNARNHLNKSANKSDAELRENLQASRQMLTGLIESLADRPDMQNSVRRLMRPDDMLETFSELAVIAKSPLRSTSIVTHRSPSALAKSKPISYLALCIVLRIASCRRPSRTIGRFDLMNCSASSGVFE